MRRSILWTLGAILAALIASVIFMAGGFSVSRGETAAFSLDWRADMRLSSEGVSIAFTPEVGSVYDIALFPGDACSITSVQVRQGGLLLADGTDKLSVELAGGTEYTLTARGAGECTAELMRRSPGRSITQPAVIRGGAAGGMIAREGSAGWYRFTGGDGLCTVCVEPGSGIGLSLEALIYDRGGRIVAESSYLESGACALYFKPEKGEKYYLRVSSPDGGKGMYSVSVRCSGDEPVQSLDFATGDLSMRVGDMRAARANVQPDSAPTELIWFSSEPEVASVSGEGYIAALAPGETIITAYAYGGISHSISVSVAAIEPQDIMYVDGSINIPIGDRATPRLTVYPAAASGTDIDYSSSNPSVVAVSDNGEITALSMGGAVVTARHGELSDSIIVYVEEAPARRRALLIGEQLYAAGVNTVRVGSVNTVYCIESLLKTARFANGTECDVRVELDLNRAETLDAIAETFADARDDDVSILYITCHGSYRNGMSILQFCDGSELAACDLELALRKIPGTIVLLIDCCDSGGFVGTYGELSNFTGGVMAAFTGGEAPFAGSKYKILASASIRQDSYRLGYGEDEGAAATVFARALCDGLGWDMDEHARGVLNADANYDGQITFWETYLYASRRVSYYLDIADGGSGSCIQDVQVYPKGDGFVLFER